ncbi:hypothetical protein MLD38_020520 [Melastoma candidum]|uniref:Uncharacterized protein n=1 Tax=Melastoma candidum TaxID=119954 RepID=A0ACB9QCM4_9MYRT|nr:hypothetical protein MLD38_020520 [Melastoma candidum]
MRTRDERFHRWHWELPEIIIIIPFFLPDGSQTISFFFGNVPEELRRFPQFQRPRHPHSIISHLSRALSRSGVYAFKDSEELEAGNRRDDLFDAIKESRAAVVVFSESYADSKWCLDELTKILESRNMGKLTVIPIFYRVPAGEVRLHEKQNAEKGCYQIAMEAMEAKYGRDDEGEVVDKVVKRVLKVCSDVPLHVAKYPVGIGHRVTEIKPLLHLDPHVNDVYFIGIRGLGGVGKTTLSKAICNDIRHEYDAWCFLPNVRETSKFCNGLLSLHEKLLQHFVNQMNLSVSSIDMYTVLIRERLRRKKVLVVLDDVDKLDQFDAMAGSHDWFGDGSRMVITTRDSHVLAHDRIQHI